jgi:hypothetical protein
MPLVGAGHSLNLVGDEAPYFTSLDELDSWMDKPSRKLRSVLPYTPRSRQRLPCSRGSSWCVLPHYPGTTNRVTHTPQVCHDYKVKPAPILRIVFSCELSARGDIPRNPRHSHTPLISGHTVRHSSSMFYVCRRYWHGVLIPSRALLTTG